MTRALVPPLRVALRFPSVALAVGAAALLPAFVRWGGSGDSTAVRLRLTGLVLAALVSTAWEERCRGVVAATPVGEPATRHGRALLVGGALLAGYVASCALATGHEVPWATLHVHTLSVAVLVAAVVGRLSRDGSTSALVLPLPVLLVSGILASRLPAELSLLRTQSGEPGWSDERLRWCAVALLSLVVVVSLDRDPASRRPWRSPS